MKKTLLLLIIFLLSGWVLKAQKFQELLKKSEVHGSFQFDGRYYMPDSALGITEKDINGKNYAFNAFGNITYTLGNFSAGLRYEAFLPPLLGYDPRLEGQGFPYLWAMYNHEKFSITIGNFYEQFGNGLTFRTYEEWQLGYDNSVNGARVTYEPIKGILLKAIYGTQRFFWDKWEPNGRGIVKGIDGEFDFNQMVKSMNGSSFRLILGASAVSKYQVDLNPKYNLPENVSNIGGRMKVGYKGWNLDAEYAWKVNDPSAVNKYIYKDGEALMLSLTYSTKGFGFFGMFKRYDNMSYKSDRNVTANALDINFLPPNTEIHTYMLTGMYPYATQPNGEIGFQLQVTYKIPKKSKLGGKYGMGIMVNYSQVNNIVRNQVNDSTPVGKPGTLGWTANFFSFADPIFWQDFNIEIDKKFSAIIHYMYQTFDIAVLQGHDGWQTIYSNIGVIDMTYKFNRNHALRWELQGMWKEQNQDSANSDLYNNGNWASALIEYTVSPHWSISVWDQWNYGNPDKDKGLHYYNFQFAYTRKATRIALAYGRQRDGVICVGGVCNYVPKSNGFRVTITSNF